MSPVHELAVSVDELRNFGMGPGLIVADSRFDLIDPDAGLRRYREGHIPGARYVDLNRDLAGPVTADSGRHPLPDPADFERMLQRLGVGPDSQVVVYDDVGGSFACRFWWMLQAAGHRAAAVLDGGWGAWVRSGNPCRTGEEEPATASDYRLKHDFRGWIQLEPEGLGRRSLIDARAPGRFAGLEEPIDPVAGHIPGAVNIFWQENLDENGHFLPPETLREMYRDFTEPVFYCGSGVTSCHDIFSFRRAGFSGERLYVGSWSQWSRRFPDQLEK